MLHFSDLQRKPVPEQLLSFADAYLESASVLCERVCTEPQHATYAHGAVIMSLTFHSLELFLKAAILRKVPAEKLAGHDLELLEKRYSNLYPEKKHTFDIPFKRQAPDTQGLSPQIAEELLAYVRQQNKNMPEDQLHRYPISAQGETWNPPLGFEPHSFHRVIQGLKSDFARLKPDL